MIKAVKNIPISIPAIFAGIILLSFAACDRDKRKNLAEDWIKLPVKEWPQIAMTNEVVIDDTTFTDFASSFLVDTGKDTLAITVKHVFSVFAAKGLFTVDFKDKLKSWKMYPKNNREEIIEVGELVNRNPGELAAMPNSTNNTDWLVFKIKSGNKNIHPLKLGDGSFEKGEYLYNLGWNMDESDGQPKLYKFRVFRMVGNQIFMEPVEFTENPAGLSGSPIFNSKGQLVAISSGAEGNLARACSVYHLFEILEKYNLAVKPIQ